MAKIERDALLAPVEGLEEERVLSLLERRHVAPHVAGGGRILELHDLGAEIGELQGAPWACPELLDREHTDVGEWERSRRCPDGDEEAESTHRLEEAALGDGGVERTRPAPASRNAPTRPAHSSGVPTTQSRSTWCRSNCIP